ncbi:MAG TPA: hypothetical protein VE987_15640 [Polyangiaceae bacterium]|nr:hypothetical protein [Polyangiaceae bacterium]
MADPKIVPAGASRFVRPVVGALHDVRFGGVVLLPGGRQCNQNMNPCAPDQKGWEVRIDWEMRAVWIGHSGGWAVVPFEDVRYMAFKPVEPPKDAA